MAANDDSANPASPSNPDQANVRLRYDTMETSFASQFIVNASREEIILNLSPGYIAEPGSGDHLLPVQTRVAMTPQGAARLVKTLATVLRNSFGITAGIASESKSEKTD